MRWPFGSNVAMPSSITPDTITWEGMECALGLMRRLLWPSDRLLSTPITLATFNISSLPYDCNIPEGNHRMR